jgi:hypothetical protein
VQMTTIALSHMRLSRRGPAGAALAFALPQLGRLGPRLVRFSAEIAMRGVAASPMFRNLMLW